MKLDGDDRRLLRISAIGALMFCGFEMLSADRDFANAAMFGALAFPVIRTVMNRKPIIMVMPDSIEVDHTVTPKTVTTEGERE